MALVEFRLVNAAPKKEQKVTIDKERFTEGCRSQLDGISEDNDGSFRELLKNSIISFKLPCAYLLLCSFDYSTNHRAQDILLEKLLG